MFLYIAFTGKHGSCEKCLWFIHITSLNCSSITFAAPGLTCSSHLLLSCSQALQQLHAWMQQQAAMYMWCVSLEEAWDRPMPMSPLPSKSNCWCLEWIRLVWCWTRLGAYDDMDLVTYALALTIRSRNVFHRLMLLKMCLHHRLCVPLHTAIYPTETGCPVLMLQHT